MKNFLLIFVIFCFTACQSTKDALTLKKKNSSDEINLVLLKKIGFPVISKIYKKNKIKVFLKKELLN